MLYLNYFKRESLIFKLSFYKPIFVKCKIIFYNKTYGVIKKSSVHAYFEN